MSGEVLVGRVISHHFGGLQALVNVDFAVESGLIYAVIGPNGAGKTTLFNIVSGLQKGFSGKVIFDGCPVEFLLPHQLCKLGMARTFQNVRLFKNLSVLENVMVGCHGWIAPGFLRAVFRGGVTKRDEQRARDVAMEMLAFAGLERRTDDEVESLPLGEQKLLEIARALASRPKLLLLDEPGAGLNDAEMLKLREILFRIKENGVTQMVVEHNMPFIMTISDRIMVLNFGVKIAEGTAEELVHNEEVVEVYLGREEEVVCAP